MTVGDLQPALAGGVIVRGRPNVAIENRVSETQSTGVQGRRGGIPQDQRTKSSVGAEQGHREVKGAPMERSRITPKGGSEMFLAYLRDSQQSGTDALAEFHRAPAITKEAFWAEVRKRTETAHLESMKAEAEAAETGLSLRDFYAAVLLIPWDRRWRVSARRIWDKRWRDRAYRDRAIEERGRLVDTAFDEQKARLLAIPSVEYAERLMPEAERRGRFITCPAHDERTPSCHLGDDPRWRCFGCDEGGSIYDFAGILWDLPRFGADFRRIHKRLVEVFG